MLAAIKAKLTTPKEETFDDIVADFTGIVQRLENRSAKRLEDVATHADGRKVLIRYTSRKGRRGLYDALTQGEPAKLCAFLGADHIDFAKKASDGGKMGEWTVRFSGRTQRDAIIGGELPFYLDATK